MLNHYANQWRINLERKETVASGHHAQGGTTKGQKEKKTNVIEAKRALFAWGSPLESVGPSLRAPPPTK